MGTVFECFRGISAFLVFRGKRTGKIPGKSWLIALLGILTCSRLQVAALCWQVRV